ncbi:MAG: amidohydrolase family protein, partial [Acidimicrobiia bacterium]
MEKRQVDLIIRNGHVFTVDNTRRVFSPGAIAVSGTDVVEVGPERTVLEGYEGSRDIDAGGAPVHPGLIESHVHASLHLVRGAVPDDLPEDDVLETLYYPYWNALNDEEEYLAVAHAAIEMVRNGTTCFMEAGTVLEPDLAAQAAEMVGIRAVIGDPFIWDRPSNYVQGKNSPEAT